MQEARLTLYFSPINGFKGTVNNFELCQYTVLILWMIYNKAPYDPELTASTGTFWSRIRFTFMFTQPVYFMDLSFEILDSKINKGIEYEKNI